MMEWTPPMGLRVEDLGGPGLHTLALSGELDVHTLTTLEAAISRACNDGTRSLTLDLRGLTFIDSSGLWLMTRAWKWCEQHGCEFTLIPGSESIQRVFEETGLSDLLPFQEDHGSGEQS